MFKHWDPPSLLALSNYRCRVRVCYRLSRNICDKISELVGLSLSVWSLTLIRSYLVIKLFSPWLWPYRIFGMIRGGITCAQYRVTWLFYWVFKKPIICIVYSVPVHYIVNLKIVETILFSIQSRISPRKAALYLRIACLDHFHR
jgi:hypothetical protein